MPWGLMFAFARRTQATRSTCLDVRNRVTFKLLRDLQTNQNKARCCSNACRLLLRHEHLQARTSG